MASPQKENGYTPIANELLEKLLLFNYPSVSPLKIALYIARKTFGYSKPDDIISLTQIQRNTNLSRQTVVSSLRWLIESNIVSRMETTTVGIKYKVQKDYEKWVVNAPRLVNSSRHWTEIQVVKPPRLVKGARPEVVKGARLVVVKPPRHTKTILKTKNNTVANATDSLIINFEDMKKSTLGRKTMVWLAARYLEAKGISLEEGESYDANKIAKGLSKLYSESNKDPYETARRIQLGSEYFDSKGLDWTPEGVWRRWEDIAKWDELGKPGDQEMRKIKQKNLNLEDNPLYE